MNIVTWKPWRELDDFFTPESFLSKRFPGSDLFPAFRTDTPRVNVVERPDEFALTLEIPGMKQEDIEVRVHNGVLTVKGESKQEEAKENETYHYREIGRRQFERNFRLGENLDWEKIDAKLDSGLLTLSIPKKEEAKPRKIDIKVHS